ncbi:two-component regulator propeller domain-containing protein [Pseudotenacibaculum sp. MALMAid0570]|uniref:type IX secretion system anionic LPS delivery protein PorZ n=1 Tax=Pseudotenacibaculum sp. MALMAid0570 TaxID=3143938 RepID=UPI0032DEA2B7
MRKFVVVLALFLYSTLSAQVDFSDSWEDFFSYNNVKDFVKVDNTLYALSDNAIFTYNITTQEIQKLSSVQGLSGETTTSIHFSRATNRLVIGYENGLIEVVDEDGGITISADIVNFNQSGEKSINDIYEYQGKLYLSTAFAVVEYDINELEFGDTFFIGNNSTDVKVNEIAVFNDLIYAATDEGVFYADVNSPNLIDFNNWQQIVGGNNLFKNITVFNNRLFTILNTGLFEIVNTNGLSFVRDFFETVNGLKESSTNLTVALNQSLFVFNSSLNVVLQNSANTAFNYNLNTAFSESNILYLATQQYGVLSSSFGNPSSFTEIHPEGPVSNDVFSISAQNNHVWIVYGGYTPTFAPIQRRLGYSHFNGESWFTAPNDPANPFPDLVDVTIDPNDANNAFISSFGDTNLTNTINTGGLFEIQNNQTTNFYNHLNSGLEEIDPTNASRVTIRLSGSVFDSQGNLWMTNIGTPNELKKFSGGSWSSFDISSVKTQNSFGLSEIAIDRNNSLWIGTRGDGVIAFNENGNRLKALTTTTTQGSLPNSRIESVAVDKDNRIWIGTISGLVVFNNPSGVFDADVTDAQPIIILDDGVPRRLLGEQIVNTIAVDGANNKWFGTDNGGVTYTNPNGQTTIANFSSENSPLPSNRIVKIAVDEETGKVYFATDKGVVAYNSNVSPFGDTLGEVYAYPNPVRKFHNTVTIDGRNGTSLPRGTNVKIIDVAGNLVYETNVVEGQELQGGKVVWDKTNLAGKKVASGVYIVLLSNEDATETSTTKIAIIN